MLYIPTTWLARRFLVATASGKRAERWNRWRVRALVLAALLVTGPLSIPTSLAHPPRDDYLQALTEQIAEDPSDPSLYVKRADLKRELGDISGALLDLDKAAKIRPGWDLVDLSRGLLYLSAGDPNLAASHLARFLSDNPDHPKALLAYARSLSQLGSFTEAADYYERAVAVTRNASPDFYLEWANTQLSAGQPLLALDTLDDGVRQLGPLTSLQVRAVEIAVAHGWLDDAVQRLTALSHTSPQRSRWLLRKGEVLEAAGRNGEAVTVYRQAREHLDEKLALYPNRPALLELDQQLTAALSRVGKNSIPQGQPK